MIHLNKEATGFESVCSDKMNKKRQSVMTSGSRIERGGKIVEML